MLPVALMRASSQQAGVSAPPRGAVHRDCSGSWDWNPGLISLQGALGGEGEGGVMPCELARGQGAVGSQPGAVHSSGLG